VVHYTFQHKSTITKLSQDVIQYYRNITSPIGANARIQRDTIMNSTKSAHELQKKNSRDDGKIHELQAPRSKHVGPGESELPNEWQDECQVACIDKHMCIDKSESKSMY